nr:MAG TPA: hypothetical protein [Caudoviricetes sp.]
MRILPQDRGRRGGRPVRDPLDPGDGVAADLVPGPGPPLALDLVGLGRGGDD